MFRKSHSVNRVLGTLATLGAAVAATAVIVPSGASALAIGYTDRPEAFDCVGPSTYFQQATAAASPSYTVPAGGGVITGWETLGGTSAGAQVKLGVFRPTGAPGQFTTTAASAALTVQAGRRNRADTQIPVFGGETIGLLVLSGTHQCINTFDSNLSDVGQADGTAVHDTGSTFSYSDPNAGELINVRADVLPAPRTLTLDANRKTVRRGKKVRLSGRISSPNPQACAFGQAVTLKRRTTTSKAKPKPIGQLKTDAQGRFSAKSKVKARSKFEVEIAPTPSCGGARSNQVRVKPGK
jgi:hypothetical protein